VVFEIFRANGGLIEWGDRLVAPLGLTSARWQMLGAIALSAELLTAPQLAAAMGVTRQGAQKQLNLMLADGLIEQRPNPGHQRSPHYQLTRKGRALYADSERIWSTRARRLAARLPAKDVEIARRVLAALRQQLAIDHEGANP
jgi:DNA-binding MarR family transcriptional regulator